MRLSYKVIKNSNVREEKCIIPIVDNFENLENEMSSEDMVQMIDNANNIAKKIIESAENEKEQMIADSRAQIETDAEGILEELKQKAYEDGKAIGFKQGKNDGFDQGVAEGIAQGQKIEDEARAILKEAHNNAREYIDEMEVDIIELSINIAERILKTSLLNDYELIYRSAKEIIMEFKNRTQIIIRVNPNNIEFFLNHIDGLKEICPEATFSILNDDRVDVTGCIIENENQVISTEITSQLENVKQSLLQVRSNDGR